MTIYRLHWLGTTILTISGYLRRKPFDVGEIEAIGIEDSWSGWFGCGVVLVMDRYRPHLMTALQPRVVFVCLFLVISEK